MTAPLDREEVLWATVRALKQRVSELEEVARQYAKANERLAGQNLELSSALESIQRQRRARTAADRQAVRSGR